MVRELMNRELEIRQICTSCIVFIFEKNFYVNQSRVCDSEPWNLEDQSDWLQESRFLKGLVAALSTITTVYTFVTIVVQWWFEWERHTLMYLNIGYQWWRCAVCRGSGTFQRWSLVRGSASLRVGSGPLYPSPPCLSLLLPINLPPLSAPPLPITISSSLSSSLLFCPPSSTLPTFSSCSFCCVYVWKGKLLNSF